MPREAAGGAGDRAGGGAGVTVAAGGGRRGWARGGGLLTGLALGLVLLRRAPAPSGDAGDVAGPPSTARAILDERLARGEIDADEHARRRAVLDER